MESINERLAMLPDLLDYDSPAALAKASGLDPNTLRKAMQGPSKPSFDLLNALLGKHKKLSADWLMRGEGAPLFGSAVASNQPPPTGGGKHEGTALRKNTDGENENYWKQIAIERLSTIELLKRLLGTQFPGLAEEVGKLMHSEYAAVALAEPVGFRQAGRAAIAPAMFVARTGHPLEWVDAALAGQLPTVQESRLKKTA